VKLVFFGGCFDPPHRGHVEIIRQCLKLCDKFILMPTLSSPMKIVDSSTDPFHIMQMLNLIIQCIDRSIEIDEYDLTCSGPSYTVDTVQYLQKKYADYSISMVVGADQMMKFEHWKDYQDIINIVHIICFNRKNCHFTHLPNMSLTWIEDFKINISSEQIKKDIIKGEFNKDNLPSAVKQYIIKNQLYGYK
jgi:nicotinate-nucleotide adenylyltransferase